MEIGVSISGIHSRSEDTVRLSRDYDRARTTKEVLDKAFREDSQALIDLENSLGFSWVSDGQLAWQDLLRPLSETLVGLKIGADLSRWFDTNSFYRKPKVVAKLDFHDNEKDLVRSAFLSGSNGTNKTNKLTLPGPFTLACLVDNQFYASTRELISAFSKVLSSISLELSNNGISCLQLNEPSLVYRYGTSDKIREEGRHLLLKSLDDDFSDFEGELWLNLSFGDCSKCLSDILSSDIISLVGIDFTQTSLDDLKSLNFGEMRLGCGCVDARNSLVESPAWISEFCHDASKSLKSPNLVILPSNDLKYLPRSYADNKLRAMAEASRLLKDA